MFIWDAANTSHIALHGVSTEEAEQVMNNGPINIERQVRNSEIRFVHLGQTLRGRVLFVVITPRGQHIRIVTAFTANKQSRKFYTEQRGLEDGKNNGNS